MGVPVASLENSTKTLWLYRRNLAQATASGDKRAVASATGDLEMLAEHSRYPSVRDAAALALRSPDTTLQLAGEVRNMVESVPQDADFATADTARA